MAFLQRKLQWQNHTCSLSSCHKTAEKIFGQKVLITGSGPIGTLCAAAARRAGAEEIIVTDISTNALTFSNSVGADKVINILEEHDKLKNYQSNKGYFDIAIECSGSAQGISCLLYTSDAADRTVV